MLVAKATIEETPSQSKDVLCDAGIRSSEGTLLGDLKDNPLVGALNSRAGPGPRPTVVMLLPGPDRCRSGGCWEVSDPKPRLRLIGTLMVVLDLLSGTGLI